MASATARANRPRISGEVQPASLPSEIPASSATTAGKNKASPHQSNWVRRARFRERGMKNQPSATPRRPIGTLTQKIHRQPPAATNRPPTVGPSAKPSACAAPWIPIPRPRLSGGIAR